MKYYLSFVLCLSFAWATDQKCQYDDKSLRRSFAGNTSKIENGRKFDKYVCMGSTQHFYWLPSKKVASDIANQTRQRQRQTDDVIQDFTSADWSNTTDTEF